MITEFDKIVERCGCVFALKIETDNNNGLVDVKHIWVYVNPTCDLTKHRIKTEDDE